MNQQKMHEPKIFICIPVHNRIELTLSCLRSIYDQDYKNFQVIICDDGSTDNSAALIKNNYPDCIVVKGDGNLWWTGGINMCVEKALVQAAENDYIYTLNNDTVLLHDTLSTLIKQSTSADMIISSLNVFHDDPERIERSAFINSKLTNRLVSLTKWGEPVNRRTGIYSITTCSGKGVFIPASAFRKLGLYNQQKLPHYHADIEFVCRAKENGYRIFVSFDSRVLSHQRLSGIGTVTTNAGVKEFVKSFFTIKSTHHWASLVNYHRLVYKQKAWVYLSIDLIFIALGFVKRTIIKWSLGSH